MAGKGEAPPKRVKDPVSVSPFSLRKCASTVKGWLKSTKHRRSAMISRSIDQKMFSSIQKNPTTTPTS